MARRLVPGWCEVDTYTVGPGGGKVPYTIAVQVAQVQVVFPHTATETAIYTPQLNIHATAPYRAVLWAMGLVPEEPV